MVLGHMEFLLDGLSKLFISHNNYSHLGQVKGSNIAIHLSSMLFSHIPFEGNIFIKEDRVYKESCRQNAWKSCSDHYMFPILEIYVCCTIGSL